jgi:hypothetical protein
MRIFYLLLIVAALAVAETKLGKPLELKKTTPVADLAAKPDDYVGKLV